MSAKKGWITKKTLLSKFSNPLTFYVSGVRNPSNPQMRFFPEPLAALGMVWFVFPTLFQIQTYNWQSEKLTCAKTVESSGSQNPRPISG